MFILGVSRMGLFSYSNTPIQLRVVYCSGFAQDWRNGKARHGAPLETFARFQAGFVSSEKFHRFSKIYLDLHDFHEFSQIFMDLKDIHRFP